MKVNKALVGSIAALGIASIVVLNISSRSNADLDTVTIGQELQSHEEQLNNHEDRISNTEADVKVVQEKTDTAPSTERVVVREVTNRVTSPSPSPTPTTNDPEQQPKEQQKITITSYKVLDVENSEDKDCEITYSDGTTKTWRWQSVKYNQGTKIVEQVSSCVKQL